MTSPYPADTTKWALTTNKLLTKFPIAMGEIVEVVLTSWEDIFQSKIGRKRFEIGQDIRPEPQVMGLLLHELIPLNLAATHPAGWRRGLASSECDVVCISDGSKSFEIKTSSSRGGIFGNRSYAHVSATASKTRGSFFLAVNFGKFVDTTSRPEISLIRFGWLGAGDWIGQKTESGQQSRLTREAKAYKLKVIYEASE